LTAYLARRLAFAVILIATVSSASFVLARLAPGDYVTATLGGRASSEAIARERARLGLDQSLAAQYRA
jgi:peptide/nickel transport system permease protein